MTALGESLRALSPLREAQFQFSASVRGGVVPDWRKQFIGFFGGDRRTPECESKWQRRELPASTLHAGQAQQDGPPQPPQVCPAFSTPTPALVGKEFK